MGFSRQEYWSGLPFPSPGDLLDPGIKPGSPTLQADCLPFEPRGKPLTGREEAPPSAAPRHAYSHSISTPPAHSVDEETEAGNGWASAVHGWDRTPGGWTQACLPQVGGGGRVPGAEG